LKKNRCSKPIQAMKTWIMTTLFCHFAKAESFSQLLIRCQTCSCRSDQN
jgi:hypothetical protein